MVALATMLVSITAKGRVPEALELSRWTSVVAAWTRGQPSGDFAETLLDAELPKNECLGWGAVEKQDCRP